MQIQYTTKRIVFISLLFIGCQKSLYFPKNSLPKEAKPAAIDTVTAPVSTPLSDSVANDQEEMPRQEGTPITVNGRLFIKH